MATEVASPQDTAAAGAPEKSQQAKTAGATDETFEWGATVDNLPEDAYKCPKGEHRLQTPWTIHFYNKGRVLHQQQQERLTREAAAAAAAAKAAEAEDAQDEEEEEEEQEEQAKQKEPQEQEPETAKPRQSPGQHPQGSPQHPDGPQEDPVLPNNRKIYLDSLKSVGTFNSVESFWRYYCHLRRPSDMGNGYNVAVFRAGLVPAWESFTNGGCWIVRVPISSRFLDRLWEELLMAVVGENFLTPELVGVVVAVRHQWVNMTVWNRDNWTNPDVRFRIGERLKELLNLDEKSTIEYKFFKESMYDGSTHRNATAYTYTMVNPN